MMLSTTDWFDGRRIVRFPGVASADVVLGPRRRRDVFAAVRDMPGDAGA